MGVMQNVATATIANGQSLSGPVFLGVGVLNDIQMPAAWTAANLTFQTSPDGVTYTDLKDDAGNEVVVTAAAAISIKVDPATFLGAMYMKVRSGTSGTPVNQLGTRSIILRALKIWRSR